MEKSKHSEEEIIKLGEKLVKELGLEYSTNTLAKWMSHYISELIHNIDNSDSKEEKILLREQCCDLILKVWSEKEHLPIKKPLDDLKPIIEIIEVLREKKEIGILPQWIEHKSLDRNSIWATFVDKVKNNSEKIFKRVIEINLHEDILLKDQEWMNENKSFLREDEILFIEILDTMCKSDYSNHKIDFNNLEIHNDNKLRLECAFEELEKLIEDQKEELSKIKNIFLRG